MSAVSRLCCVALFVALRHCDIKREVLGGLVVVGDEGRRVHHLSYRLDQGTRIQGPREGVVHLFELEVLGGEANSIRGGRPGGGSPTRLDLLAIRPHLDFPGVVVEANGGSFRIRQV